MNSCFFTGRTTKDIELRYTQGGDAIGKFSLAVDTGFGEKKKTSFLNMTVWGKRAEAMEKYVKKGTKIVAVCSAMQNQYTDKNGNKVNAVDFSVNDWEFCESKGSAREEERPVSDGFMHIPDGVEDDDLPFN